MNQKLNFTTPVGRLVGGSLYEPVTTDFQKQPLVYRSGPKAGQPRKVWRYSVAYPKTPGARAFWEEPWLAQVVAEAQKAWPQGQWQQPTFHWKIVDGDSTIPDDSGRAPNSRVGYPGHWIMKFSSDYPSKIYNANGTQELTAPDAVKRGYYVQVNVEVEGNKQTAKPGMYINHRMVALAGYGEEIYMGPDPTSAGFGQGAVLPAGASAAPLAGMAPGLPQAPGMMPVPAMPGMPMAAAPAPMAPVPQAPVMAVPPMPVAPAAPMAVPPGMQAHPGFLAGPGAPVQPMTAPAMPAVPAPPPAIPPAPIVAVSPSNRMTAAAGGNTYEAYRAANWSDAQLIAAGYMTP